MTIRVAFGAQAGSSPLLALPGFRVSENGNMVFPPQNGAGNSPVCKGEGALSPHLRGSNEIGWERRDD